MIVLKIAVAVIILSVPVGAWLGYKQNAFNSRIEGVVAGGFAGLGTSTITFGLLIALAAGLKFIFS